MLGLLCVAMIGCCCLCIKPKDWRQSTINSPLHGVWRCRTQLHLTILRKAAGKLSVAYTGYDDSPNEWSSWVCLRSCLSFATSMTLNEPGGFELIFLPNFPRVLRQYHRVSLNGYNPTRLSICSIAALHGKTACYLRYTAIPASGI